MIYSEDYIVKYIRGDLTDRENRQIEAAMEVDPSLKKEVAFHQNLMKGLEKKFKREAKRKLEEYETALQKENAGNHLKTTHVHARIKPYLKVAAALLIGIIMVGAGYLYQITTPSGSKLAYHHFDAYPNHITQQYRGASKENNQQPLLVKAMNAYSAKRYDAAIKHLKGLLEKGKGGAVTHFYLGNAYLAKKRAGPAIRHLKEAKEAGLPEKFQNANLWFLSIANLSKNQQDKAYRFLDSLCNRSDGFYHRKAKALQEKIKAIS